MSLNERIFLCVLSRLSSTIIAKMKYARPGMHVGLGREYANVAFCREIQLDLIRTEQVDVPCHLSDLKSLDWRTVCPEEVSTVRK